MVWVEREIVRIKVVVCFRLIFMIILLSLSEGCVWKDGFKKNIKGVKKVEVMVRIFVVICFCYVVMVSRFYFSKFYYELNRIDVKS